MSKARKFLDDMRRNPRDWRIEDVVTVAEFFGFKVSHGKGSHVTLRHRGGVEILTVPARKPIKPVYVRKLVQLIDDLEVTR